MENLIRDIKLGTKLLWKDRGFAATIILTLAVCIGANTAIFTVVQSVLLRPLPVPDAERIVLLSNQYPGAGVPETFSAAVPDYFDRLRDMTVFEEQAMFRYNDLTVEINGAPERIKSMAMTPSLTRLLRVGPAQGRPFTEAEGEIGNEQKVALSYGLWQDLYGGDAGVLGKDLRLSGRPFTIVGIMPKNFLFLDPEVRLWTPYVFTAQQKSDDDRHSNNSSHVARLKPTATIEQAEQQVDALNAANLERFPKMKSLLINAGYATHIWPLQDVVVREVKSTLYMLWAGAAFVLLIGSVNIANLVLARSSLRRKELATRLALGSSRFQVARHLLMESVLVALIGGLAGLALGAGTLRALRSIGLDLMPRASEIHMDMTIVALVFAISLVVGVLIGLVPLAHLRNVRLSALLHEEGRTGTGGRRARSVRRTLVVTQVAFAFLLLIGSGLLLASFNRLLAIDPGFKAEGVVTASTTVARTKYRNNADIGLFLDRTFEAFSGVPGVTAVGATTTIPLSENVNMNVIVAEGYVMKPGESLIAPLQVQVSPGYFEAIGSVLTRGRYFNAQDNQKAPNVVIVDASLARRFWGEEDPIGKRLYDPSDLADPMQITEKTRMSTVVGVIRDVKLTDLAGARQTVGAYYFPLAQMPARNVTLAVKGSIDQALLRKALRAEMRNIDPEIPLFDMRTMAERTQLSLMSRRAAMTLALAFSGVALFLSAIGIYGVLTYLVAQRTREIGIRIALGGSNQDIFRLVLREGLMLVGIGLVIGLAGARALRSAIESQVYGVQPMDPIVIGIVIVSLAVVALAACLLPARRATQVDPVIVLNAG